MKADFYPRDVLDEILDLIESVSEGFPTDSSLKFQTKLNKPIRSAIFNFNQVVSDLDIETCIADSSTVRTLKMFIRPRVM